MKKKQVKILPNSELKNHLYPMVGNRNVLYIICEPNQMDALKIKGKVTEQAKKRRVEVYCPTTDTTYPSIQQAAIELILDPGAISKCLAGKQESTKGYTFRREK